MPSISVQFVTNFNLMFEKSTKFHKNPSNGSQVAPCGQMDDEASYLLLTSVL
jgi:hypothetical protein